MSTRIALLVSLGLLASACSAYSPAVPASQALNVSQTPVVSTSLTDAHIKMIRDYYAGNDSGKGKKNGLPPGIAKNLQRGKPLPPGIAKQYLPQDLLLRLPRPGDGLEYLVVAGKLLLVEVTTQVIREVLLDAVFD
ncbi:MAG TPA: anti-virulence regulator CigR family protein [Woeseiaceae bacterium]|nr:anti-virulence regulator CigR family protein [Woeseiaceae bacterium]